jgi:hypothetical protein
MGTHGSPPTRVLEVPVKWARPARSSADLPEAQLTWQKLSRPASGTGDLIRSPGDLGRLWTT